MTPDEALAIVAKLKGLSDLAAALYLVDLLSNARLEGVRMLSDRLGEG